MTGADLETAAADSAASFVRRKKRPFTQQGEPCKNCGTPLEGWYCHSCGQNADTHHRSILHLIWEAIEGMFHLDGRLANTLPLLFFNPGKLAKDYMEGRIARHVPPFRTFLVALLLFIFAAEHAIHGVRHAMEQKEEKEIAALATPQGRKAKAEELRREAAALRAERLGEAATERDADLKEANADKVAIAAEYADDVKTAESAYARQIAEAAALEKNINAAADAKAKAQSKVAETARQIRDLKFNEDGVTADGERKLTGTTADGVQVNVTVPGGKLGAAHPANTAGEGWFKDNLAKAVENPDYYLVVMFGWAHRLAVLLLPIMGLSLALVYVNRRQFFIYDHLLVATNLI